MARKVKITARDERDQRRIRAKFSSKAAFDAWVRGVPLKAKGNGGRREIPEDERVLPFLSGYFECAKFMAGLTPTEALRVAVEHDIAQAGATPDPYVVAAILEADPKATFSKTRAHPGSSPEHIAARLYRKWKLREARKRLVYLIRCHFIK